MRVEGVELGAGVATASGFDASVSFTRLDGTNLSDPDISIGDSYSSKLVGDIAADAILIHEGGKVHGRLQIRSEAAERERTSAASGPTLRLPSPVTAEA